MSGIYISGMEMPTRCYACPCADLEYYDCNLMPGTRIEQHKRLDDCPLVPVPERGGLCNKDDVLKVIDNLIGRTANKEAHEVLKWAEDCLRVLPTLIPASGKEGEGC